MLLYSWNKILNKSNTVGDALAIMHSLVWPEALRPKQHKRLHKLQYYDYSGLNFLLNPHKLLTRTDLPPMDIIEYISLASKRNLADYLLTGNKKLDSRLAKVLPTNNQLLTIQNNEISFAYE